MSILLSWYLSFLSTLAELIAYRESFIFAPRDPRAHGGKSAGRGAFRDARIPPARRRWRRRTAGGWHRGGSSGRPNQPGGGAGRVIARLVGRLRPSGRYRPGATAGCATAPRLSGRAPTFLDHAHEYRTPSADGPRANHRRGRHPPAAHPHPRAGGRGDGPRRGGRRDGRRASGGAKRVMPPNPAIGKLSPGATASRACRPRVGISVKCPLGDPGGRGRLPPAAHPHQRAGGRGDGARRGVGMIPPARVRQGRTKTWAEGWHIPPRASRPCPGSGLPVGGVNVNGPHRTHDQPKPVN